MDKQTESGHNSFNQGDGSGEGETIHFGLTLEQASSLIIILHGYAEEATRRVKTIEEMITSYKKDGNEYWVNKLSEQLGIEKSVLNDANLIYVEAAKILQELEKPKPVIIKPTWKDGGD